MECPRQHGEEFVEKERTDGVEIIGGNEYDCSRQRTVEEL